MNIKHIVGPPGCGKTYRLMEYIELLLGSGLGPEEIGFVSFTRAAVGEATKRVTERFGYLPTELPYFRTLHSLAYRHAGIGQANRFTGKRWKEFCRAHNLPCSDTDGIPDEDPFEPLGSEEGDVLRRFYDWRRNCLLPFKEAVRAFDAGLDAPFSAERAAWFEKELEAFKAADSLWDFTDTLLELDSAGWVPPMRVLIVDEAQDLSPLQRRIVERFMERVGHCLLAYDEDQAIYGFQGAEPGWLLEMEGAREFLKQSHRVPRRPAKVARGIIERNQQRYPKTWNPRHEEGAVSFDSELDEVVGAAAGTGESWYFLARNRFYLAGYCRALMDAGLPFINLRGAYPQVSAGVVVAMRLANGEAVTVDDLSRLADKTTAKDWWVRGAKAELERRAAVERQRVTVADLAGYGALPALMERLSEVRTCLAPLKTAEENKGFFLRVFRRYGLAGLTDEPNRKVSTMHGVKGGQADHVVLNVDMTRKTADGYEDFPEPERRVWYVGVSRTREKCYILSPSSRRFFDEF